MYITKVRIKNIRCFEDLEIKFPKPKSSNPRSTKTKPSKTRSSVLFTGDNGDGKTTILRCIAMGLCDQASAAALLRELPGEFIRRVSIDESNRQGEIKSAKIEIYLEDSNNIQYRIKTEIKKIKSHQPYESVKRDIWEKRKKDWGRIDDNKFPWKELFVSAYGAGLRTLGTEDFQHYRAVDAVYPIFRYDSSLQSPELAMRRLIDKARYEEKDPNLKQNRADEMLTEIKNLLIKILNLEDDKGKIYLETGGIFIESNWGKIHLSALGDGYKATVTWVLDLLSWWLLLKESPGIHDISGIVLIDEIENHLHPKWQRLIIKLLYDNFNEIQFILTTHSSLCAQGTVNILDEMYNVHNLRRIKEKHIVVTDPIEIKLGFRADQVLTSPAFGLKTSRPLVAESKIERFKELVQKRKRNSNDNEELKNLKKEFEKIGIVTGETHNVRFMHKEIENLLDNIKRRLKKE